MNPNLEAPSTHKILQSHSPFRTGSSHSAQVGHEWAGRTASEPGAQTGPHAGITWVCAETLALAPAQV